jgi:hypothetical protein
MTLCARAVQGRTGTTKMNLSDAKILVVEDDPLMRTFTVNLLKRLGIVHFQECALMGRPP